MSEKAITPFQRNLEYWENVHVRQTISSVGNKISDAIREHQKKSTKLANNIIVSQERIAKGIDSILIEAERISEGLEGIKAVFDWGFSEIVWQLEQERELLVSIKKVLEAPLNTQAKELRKRAEEAYKNGWMQDALEDFLESAKKNRYDFIVHQYLGNIYLFEAKNPEKALEYYEKAEKYSIPNSSYHASIALLHIGLIKYLQEDYQKAIEATSKAIELKPDFWEAHFQHAQYCAVVGKYNEAIEHLRKAAWGDLYYLIKADLEKDFAGMKKQLLELFDEFRNYFKNRAQKAISEAKKIIQDAKLNGADNYSSSYEILNTAKGDLKNAEVHFSWNSVFDYFESVLFALSAKRNAVDSLVKSLSLQISDVENEYREGAENDKQKKKSILRWDFWICLGAFVMAAIIFKNCIYTFGLSFLIFILILIYSQTPYKNRKFYEEKLGNLRDKLSKSKDIQSKMELK